MAKTNTQSADNSDCGNGEDSDEISFEQAVIEVEYGEFG
jgi:hypothetical protein